jgi:hypothetical protein
MFGEHKVDVVIVQTPLEGIRTEDRRDVARQPIVSQHRRERVRQRSIPQSGRSRSVGPCIRINSNAADSRSAAPGSKPRDEFTRARWLRQRLRVARLTRLP